MKWPNTWFSKTIYFLFTSLVVCSAAFFNKYPLVTEASGAFMEAGFNLQPPPGQPFGYALFIRIVGWQATFWTVVIAQGMLLNYLLIVCTKRLLPNLPFRAVHGAAIIFLSLFSSMSWLAGTLLPDIWMPMFILAVFLVFTAPKLNLRHLILPLFIAFLGITSQASHVWLAAGMLLLLLAYGRIRRNAKEKLPAFRLRNYLVAGIVICAILSIPIYNVIQGNGFRMGLSIKTHMLRNLDQMGELRPFLLANCGTKEYLACPLADAEEGAEGFAFRDSLFNSTDAWEDPVGNYGMLWQRVLHGFGNLMRHGLRGIRAGFGQLLDTGYGSQYALFWEGTAPHAVISAHLNHEYKEFMNSRQNRDNLKLGLLLGLNLPVLLISLFTIFWGMWVWKPGADWHLLSFLVCTGIVLNVFIQGIFFGVESIAGARMMWLLPMNAFLLLCWNFEEELRFRLASRFAAGKPDSVLNSP